MKEINYIALMRGAQLWSSFKPAKHLSRSISRDWTLPHFITPYMQTALFAFRYRNATTRRRNPLSTAAHQETLS